MTTETLSTKHDIKVRAYSCLPYTPASFAQDDVTARYNRQIYALKDIKPIARGQFKEPAADFFANLVHPDVHHWFEDAVIVPLPGSDVGSKAKTALFAAALGARFKVKVADVLSRSTPVLSSHSARRLGKPRTSIPEHVGSLTLSTVPTSKRVVLVDDVLTQGSLATASAWKLTEAGYKGEIYVVAGAHTRGRNDGFDMDAQWSLFWTKGEAKPLKMMVMRAV